MTKEDIEAIIELILEAKTAAIEASTRPDDFPTVVRDGYSWTTPLDIAIRRLKARELNDDSLTWSNIRPGVVAIVKETLTNSP